MVSQSSFDDLIRQELRGRTSQRGDSQQEARDRVARRLNVKSGKNPNPRTSTAYKPEPDQPRSKQRAGSKAVDDTVSTESTTRKYPPRTNPDTSMMSRPDAGFDPNAGEGFDWSTLLGGGATAAAITALLALLAKRGRTRPTATEVAVPTSEPDTRRFGETEATPSTRSNVVDAEVLPTPLALPSPASISPSDQAIIDAVTGGAGATAAQPAPTAITGGPPYNAPATPGVPPVIYGEPPSPQLNKGARVRFRP